MNFNTNSDFELISVILSSFASESETKEFCDSFKQNNYQIDYTVEYHPYKSDARNMLVVIGTDYWVITIPDKKVRYLVLMSNESRSHQELGPNYSATFLIHMVHKNRTNIIGFIQVR